MGSLPGYSSEFRNIVNSINITHLMLLGSAVVKRLNMVIRFIPVNSNHYHSEELHLD